LFIVFIVMIRPTVSCVLALFVQNLLNSAQYKKSNIVLGREANEMRMFLLKQIAQLTKTTVENVTISVLKPSAYAYILAAVVMAPLHAGEKLSDAELDTKYIEVQIKQICVTENIDKKDTDKKDTDNKVSKQICNTDYYLVAQPQQNDDADQRKKSVSSNQSEELPATNPLLSAIIQNLRSLGGSDMLGVPIGVSNTGVPVGFGSEQYSYKWAGNLGDIFQPIYSGGVMAPYSVYDYSSLGYGFREEAHIPYNLPQPTIQSINTRN
ncbi:MAG: hypothetical protein H7Z73_12760, partial [Candidatus Saccharibacteria bacterium]|nr:hypothetical protein [Moraxellaceae bacterium]